MKKPYLTSFILLSTLILGMCLNADAKIDRTSPAHLPALPQYQIVYSVHTLSNLSDADLASRLEFFHNHPQFDGLILNNCTVGPTALHKLILLINAHFHRFERLTFDRTRLLDHQLRSLLEAAKHNPHLKNLFFWADSFPTNGLPDIVVFLNEHLYLRKLQITGRLNADAQSSLPDLAEAIIGNPNLQEFVLSGSGIPPQARMAFSQYVETQLGDRDFVLQVF